MIGFLRNRPKKSDQFFVLCYVVFIFHFVYCSVAMEESEINAQKKVENERKSCMVENVFIFYCFINKKESAVKFKAGAYLGGL